MSGLHAAIFFQMIWFEFKTPKDINETDNATDLEKNTVAAKVQNM